MSKDKRDYTRCSVFLAPLSCERSDRESAQMTISDVSGSGIGIVTNEKVKEGETIDLELSIPGDDIPIFVAGKITWVVKDKKDENTYRAGVNLINLNRTDKARLMKYIEYIPHSVVRY